MLKTLFDANNNNHFVTDFCPETGVKRDFVDYDSNLLTLAFAEPPISEFLAENIFKKVDSGNYTHERTTYVSEIPYDGYTDCYIKKKGTVCGDSVITMGRVGWADAYARKRYGRLEDFNDLILNPI